MTWRTAAKAGMSMLLVGLALASAPARASVFTAWEVANLPFGDTLNVRKYPASTSQKRGAYPNGTVLSMTGRCTGGVNILDMETQPRAKKLKAVQGRWCEVWHDPKQSGDFELGWVYGRYIVPH